MSQIPTQLNIGQVTPSGGRGLPFVSILVINFQGAALTRACLQSLRQLDYPNYEIIVADNGSSPEHRGEVLAVFADFPEIKPLLLDTNSGFAGGNNAALREARGDFILLLNNDTVVNPGFLRALVDYLLAHREAGVVQGKMLLPRCGNTLDVCGSFATAIGLPYHYGYYKPDGPKYERAVPVFGGKGACLLFRREVVEAVGGFLFDPDFFCYYEETDFCHRAWLSGFEVHFVPSPAIQHFMGGTSDRMKRGFALEHYQRNMAFSLWGNLSAGSLLRVMPLFLGLQIAALLIATLLGRGWQCRAHWEALICLCKRWKKIRERRKLIARIRRRSDAEIFAKMKRTPRLSYFIKTFTGDLANYVDDV